MKSRFKVTTLDLATSTREVWTPSDEAVRIAGIINGNVILPHLSHPWEYRKSHVIRWRKNQTVTMWTVPMFGKYDALNHVEVNFRFSYVIENKQEFGCIINLALLMVDAFGTVVHWPSPPSMNDGKTTTFYYSCFLAG